MKGKNELKSINKFEVEDSRFGKGCYATIPMRQGETICFFTGEETAWKESEIRYIKGLDRLDDPFQISETKYLELYEPYIYFNHSCDPSSGFRGENEMIAIRDINPGKEITYDYSTVTWDDRWAKIHGAWIMECRCEEENCRKMGGDFLNIPGPQRIEYLKLVVVPDLAYRTISENHYLLSRISVKC